MTAEAGNIKVRTALERIAPKSGDILVLSYPQGAFDHEMVYTTKMFQDALNSMGIPNVLFVTMPVGQNLTKLTEKQLKEIGLQRIPESDS